MIDCCGDVRGKIYSRLALTDAQTSYDQAISRFPV
ncbi:hypothetical protein SAMN05428934_1271 [Tessaracoccus flavus]|nr:hypothetical protein SAMN05428934_1271 [Tessaracoccus flavus]